MSPRRSLADKRAAQVEKVMETLRQAAANRNPEIMRQLATDVVGLRQLFTWDDMPDWGGRSQEYRDTIYRVYRDAGAPSDSVDGLQANLRYHVGNVVREIAPPEDLAALGMDPEGPRGRAVRARSNQALRQAGRRVMGASARAAAMASPLAIMSDPAALLSFATDALRRARALEPHGEMAEALEPMVKALTEEAFDLLADLRANQTAALRRAGQPKVQQSG